MKFIYRIIITITIFMGLLFINILINDTKNIFNLIVYSIIISYLFILDININTIINNNNFKDKRDNKPIDKNNFSI